VRLISYFCILCGQEFLSNNIPVVIQGEKMARPDNAGGIKKELRKYFAVYQQQIVC